MTLASGATINVASGEIAEMLDDEGDGRLTIRDQDINVDNGTISVDTANDLEQPQEQLQLLLIQMKL